MHKMPPTIKEAKSRLPIAPTEEQDLINNIKSTFVNAIIPKKKNNGLFSDSTPRGMKMKQQMFQSNEKRIDLKAFPGAQANQLNNYVIPTLEEFDCDCARIDVGMYQQYSSMEHISEVKDEPKK